MGGCVGWARLAAANNTATHFRLPLLSISSQKILVFFASPGMVPNDPEGEGIKILGVSSVSRKGGGAMISLSSPLQSRLFDIVLTMFLHYS